MQNPRLHKDRCIGSSDAPVIMQVCPWKTKEQLWEEMVFGKEDIDNPAMKRGREMEPKAIEWFENKMRVSLVQQLFLKHKDYPWMTATLDGINEHKNILVEIKCPGKASHQFVETNQMVPPNYVPQLQHQLAVTGYKKMYFCSFRDDEGIIIEMNRNEEYIQNLIKEEEAFWKSLLDLEPPKIRSWKK